VKGAPGTLHSKYEHVYPIVRIDTPFDLCGDPANQITVVKVLISQIAAETEVLRLNQINAEKGCKYFYSISRLIDDGQ